MVITLWLPFFCVYLLNTKRLIKIMDKEKLVQQLIAIREQEKELRKQLDAVDYDERFKDAKQYEGRYFKEVNDHHKESVRCLFIYDTDKESCRPMALCVSYWIGNETAYFEIGYYGHFHPKQWEDDVDKWVEVSKEEFEHHYEEVQKRISFSVSTKNNN